MGLLLTKEEIAAERRKCNAALAASELATDWLDRAKLIYQAFPFAITGTVPGGGLEICWSKERREYIVSDNGGFLTTVPEAETVMHFVELESEKRGAVRFIITGKEPYKIPDPPKRQELKKQKISLSDLGL